MFDCILLHQTALDGQTLEVGSWVLKTHLLLSVLNVYLRSKTNNVLLQLYESYFGPAFM